MKFEVSTPNGDEIAPAEDGNLDVLIDLEDGRRFAATFFTIKNVQSLMRRHRESGECASGLYLWASDMILVESISVETIRRTVAGLIESGELEACCARL